MQNLNKVVVNKDFFFGAKYIHSIYLRNFDEVIKNKEKTSP